MLRRLAWGQTYREIAEELGVGVSTVGSYRARIAAKLNLDTRAQMVERAAALGLLERPLPADRQAVPEAREASAEERDKALPGPV